MSPNPIEPASTAGTAPPAPPSVGRYVLIEPLGEGATGEVWRAEDPRIARRVAIKLLKVPEGLSAAQRAEWERRFLLEARVAGRLSHPGIVSVHDVGSTADGRPFIVMELVEGRSLDALRRVPSPPSLEQVVHWTAQVAEALDAAHRRGVVHRDVKPANILVDADGRARIADFGIAHLAGSELTREGLFLGSPAFASPEQIRGAAVDGRADLFSLGAVFYTLATGRRPFDGDDIAALAYAVCHVDPAPPSHHDPSIGPAYDAWIRRALAKDPRERFQTGSQMAQALRNAASNPDGGSAEPENAAERTVVDGPASTATRAPLPGGAARAGSAESVATSVEDRAASAASAAAVFVVRASRVVAEVAREGWRGLRSWARRAAPVIERMAILAISGARSAARRAAARAGRLAARPTPALDAGASGVAIPREERSTGSLRPSRRRRWLVAAGLGAVAVALIAASLFLTAGRTPRRHEGLIEKLRSLGAGLSSRVGIVVEHSLAEGRLEVRCDGVPVLRESLEAPRHQVLGLSFLSYRSGTQSSAIRLPPGRHEITVEVGVQDGATLTRAIEVKVEPREAYRLTVSVGSWPVSRLALDWDRDDTRGGS